MKHELNSTKCVCPDTSKNVNLTMFFKNKCPKSVELFWISMIDFKIQTIHLDHCRSSNVEFKQFKISYEFIARKFFSKKQNKVQNQNLLVVHYIVVILRLNWSKYDSEK